MPEENTTPAQDSAPDSETENAPTRKIIFDVQKLKVTTAYQHRVMDVVPVNNLLLMIEIDNEPGLVVPRGKGVLCLTVDGLRAAVSQCYAALFVDELEEDDF